MDHAAYVTPPVKLVPSADTNRVMASLQLRISPNSPPNTLDVYELTDASGLQPLLKAPIGTVLTFLIEPTSPDIEMRTALPDPPLVRCFSNDRMAPGDDFLSLEPAIGTGRPAKSVWLDMPVQENMDEIALRRICTGATVGTTVPIDGMVRMDLSAYPCGCYALVHKDQTLTEFFLQPSKLRQTFGCIEIAVNSTTVRAPMRIVHEGTVNPRKFNILMPARACYVTYVILGLEDAKAAVKSADASLLFGTPTQVNLNGVKGLAFKSELPVALTSDLPSSTLEYSDEAIKRILQLPLPTSGQISLEDGPAGPHWVTKSFISLND